MTHGKSILLAEDEESDVEIFRLALKRAGLSSALIVVRDGQEAVDYLKNDKDGSRMSPSLVLLDLKMPRMNGFEVLAWLKTQPQFNAVPVLVLSSSSHESDIQKAREMGAHDFFVKPRDLYDLVKILQNIHVRYLSR
jgi:CheY-like chemotaxis protein